MKPARRESNKMNEPQMEVKTMRSAPEALDELQREYNVRARCFPRWIKEGRVSGTDAQDRIDRLATAIELLRVATATALVFAVALCSTGCATSGPSIIKALAADTNSVSVHVSTPWGTLDVRRNMPIQ